VGKEFGLKVPRAKRVKYGHESRDIRNHGPTGMTNSQLHCHPPPPNPLVYVTSSFPSFSNPSLVVIAVSDSYSACRGLSMTNCAERKIRISRSRHSTSSNCLVQKGSSSKSEYWRMTQSTPADGAHRILCQSIPGENFLSDFLKSSTHSPSLATLTASPFFSRWPTEHSPWDHAQYADTITVVHIFSAVLQLLNPIVGTISRISHPECTTINSATLSNDSSCIQRHASCCVCL
jgi:hypothetical protein